MPLLDKAAYEGISLKTVTLEHTHEGSLKSKLDNSVYWRSHSGKYSLNQKNIFRLYQYRHYQLSAAFRSQKSFLPWIEAPFSGCCVCILYGNIFRNIRSILCVVVLRISHTTAVLRAEVFEIPAITLLTASTFVVVLAERCSPTVFVSPSATLPVHLKFPHNCFTAFDCGPFFTLNIFWKLLLVDVKLSPNQWYSKTMKILSSN